MKTVDIVVPTLVAMVIGTALSTPTGQKGDYVESALHVPGQVQSSREMVLANAMLARMMDAAYEIAREMGLQEHELNEVQRKRNIITHCFFQAVTCY